MQNKFYRLMERPVIPGDWGDYGHILQHGMTAHLGREDGMLCLERTGPYMPPVTFPGLGDVLLREEARQLLEAGGFEGVSFRPVVKKRILELHWEKWNLSAPEPAEYPESGEPEDFVLAHPHDQRIADALGDVWELLVPRVDASVGVDLDKKWGWPTRFHVEVALWDGSELFRSNGGVFLTERAKEIFSLNWSDCISLEECP